jgi:hypothetical protein
MLGIAGCSQPAPGNETSTGTSAAQGDAAAPVDLKIVEQVQIDQDGNEVKPEAGVAAADPAGDGKATCAPVTIAMAGALNWIAHWYRENQPLTAAEVGDAFVTFFGNGLLPRPARTVALHA